MSVVVCGACLKCSFGIAPSTLCVLPKNSVLVSGVPVATTSDFVPMLNIKPFGMCSTITNPAVATATAAAFGVLTPMPCMPVIPSPWISTNPTVTAGMAPVLHTGDMCMCAYGGIISIASPGQFTVD
ncbi:MAG: DUF4280 domain-containing protein [Alphaproteobacteria bacterium]|nr:DUF4280 domain-containing protein [Alphaproteobacteria bacterium]